MAISEYINKVLDNNYLLALSVSVICVILFYLENRRAQHKYENVSYLKLIVINTIAIIGVLFLKNKKLPVISTDANVKLEIGEPNF
tara:strand:+ start:27 stop:284 length:258 start_codon:yes stop_codon:yes gene_type:complete